MALDTRVARFDLAECLRVSRARPGRVLSWNGMSLVVDARRDVLVLDDRIVITLDRVGVPVPSGRVVAGPVLARCPCGCGRRARVLWARPFDRDRPIACRSCALVEYATAATRSEVERATIALERLRRRFGLTKPWQSLERLPKQRRRTYDAMLERLRRAQRRREAALTG